MLLVRNAKDGVKEPCFLCKVDTNKIHRETGKFLCEKCALNATSSDITGLNYSTFESQKINTRKSWFVGAGWILFMLFGLQWLVPREQSIKEKQAYQEKVMKEQAEHLKEMDKLSRLCTNCIGISTSEEIENPDGCHEAKETVERWYRLHPHEAANLSCTDSWDDDVYGGCCAAKGAVQSLNQPASSINLHYKSRRW